MLMCDLQKTRPSPAKLLIIIMACCHTARHSNNIPPPVHGYTISASKGEPVVLVPIALHGDTDAFNGAINAPGVDMGEV